MSFEITTAFVQQYTANVLMIYQRQESVFRGTVREETVASKNYFFDRIGSTAAVQRTVRHGDTPLISTPHSRRMVTMSDYEWGDLVDDQDKIRLLISPESVYAKNAAWALSRSYDAVVRDAFDAAASAGETGSTSVTFASDWTATRSSTDGDRAFTSAALTLANLLTLKRELDDNDIPKGDRHIVLPPAGFEQLLKQSTTPNVSNADYMMVKALVQGEINSVLGFQFHMTTGLTTASNVVTCFAWHRDSMGIAMGKEPRTRISERVDKSYAVQVYACMTMGATRVQGEGVVRFTINDTN